MSTGHPASAGRDALVATMDGDEATTDTLLDGLSEAELAAIAAQVHALGARIRRAQARKRGRAVDADVAIALARGGVWEG